MENSAAQFIPRPGHIVFGKQAITEKVFIRFTFITDKPFKANSQQKQTFYLLKICVLVNMTPLKQFA